MYRYAICFTIMSGIALTQKSHPLLSRCLPEINLTQHEMTVSPPPSMSLAPLVLPLTTQSQGQGQGEQQQQEGGADVRQIRVCYSQHVAQRCTGPADAWFSAVLGVPCQLVRRSTSTSTSTSSNSTDSSNNSNSSGSSGSSSSFSNTAQFLLLSMTSLRFLQMKVSPTPAFLSGTPFSPCSIMVPMLIISLVCGYFPLWSYHICACISPFSTDVSHG